MLDLEPSNENLVATRSGCTDRILGDSTRLMLGCKVIYESGVIQSDEPLPREHQPSIHLTQRLLDARPIRLKLLLE